MMERLDEREVRNAIQDIQTDILDNLRRRLKYTACVEEIPELIDEYQDTFIHRLFERINSEADNSQSISLAYIEVSLRKRGITAIRRTVTPFGLYVTYKGLEFAFTNSSYGRVIKINNHIEYTSYCWHENLIDLLDIICEECDEAKIYPMIEEVIQESMKEIIRRDILIATANSIIRDRFRDEGYSVAAANVQGDNTIYYIHTRWGIIDIESPIEELASRIDEVLRAKKKVQELL